ncbi:hypothetical protein [Micromonospora sp. NBC_01796]|uniref:hypothetical protein n=1 Tax=Micromonospora sp. NBC_01796 TaxID=2975987 RepID=UPI002DD9845A|nr:hypothetical protein [Micromonospora sp. NBC_01796]WSA85857.1 hypothetical protein OIE47_36880 [Micromonospora sp. NBC_01796]
MPTYRPGRAPLSWRVLTLAFFGVVAVHLVATIVNILLLVQDYRMVRRLQTDPDGVDPSEITDLVQREAVGFAVIQLIFIAYIAGYVGWFVLSRKTVQRYGRDHKPALTHWTLTAWRVAIVALVLFSIAVGSRSTRAGEGIDLVAAAENDRYAILVTALRIPIVGLLVAGVCVVARRIDTMARSSPPRPGRYRPEPSDLGALAPSPTPQHRQAGDDAFWQAVADATARSEGPLPLLEAWADTPRARRWHLLTDVSTIAAVRTRLAPAAGVTVYGQPPRDPDEVTLGQLADEARRLHDDPSSGGAVGLIEESAGGMLRFDRLTSQAALLGWLTRARSANRVGVYPAHASADPVALSPAGTGAGVPAPGGQQ